jgi:predicted RNA methylase
VSLVAGYTAGYMNADRKTSGTWRSGGRKRGGNGRWVKNGGRGRGKLGKRTTFQGIPISRFSTDKATVLSDSNPSDKRLLNMFPPLADKTGLHVTKEGVFSMSKYTDADELSVYIKELAKTNDWDINTITDATANIGGNTLSFSKHFDNVNSVEIDKMTTDALTNNITIYNRTNIQVINSDYLNVMNDLKQDVVFFDPPWGGLNYKQHKELPLKLGDVLIQDVIGRFEVKPRLVVVKVPVNFGITAFKEALGSGADVNVIHWKKYDVIFVSWPL